MPEFQHIAKEDIVLLRSKICSLHSGIEHDCKSKNLELCKQLLLSVFTGVGFLRLYKHNAEVSTA